MLVAGFLRLSHPEMVDYHQDQADLVTLAQNLVEGKSIPLLGIPSSARLPNSPMTVYVVAIPYLFSSDPLFAAAFIAILNVVGVSLLWYLARRYLNARVALIAGLAYAVNPWAVGYSHGIWAQDYHTPIFLLGLLFGMMGFVEGKRWAQALCLPVLVIAMQIHFAAWMYMPVYLWLLWVGRPRLSKTAVAVSVFLAALTMIPFALGIIQALGTDPTLITSIQAPARDLSLREFAKPYGYIAWLMTGLGLESYSARGLEEALLAAAGVPTIVWTLLGALGLLGILAFVKSRERWLTVLVFLWIFVSIVVFTIPVISVFPHYYVPTIPALCLLIAMGADWLLARLFSNRMAAQVLLYALLALIFVTQSLFNVRANDFLDTNYTPSQFGTGPSLRLLRPVQDALRAYDDIVLIGSDDWVDLSASGASVWSSLLRDSAACTRDLIVAQDFAVLPAGPFAAVFTPRTPESTLFDGLYQIGDPTTIALRPNEGSYTIYAVEQPLNWPQPLSAIAPANFANGVKLQGYAFDSGRITFQWTLPEAQALNYTYSLQVFDAQNNVLDQRLLDFWPGKFWCAGDQLITWLDVSAPDAVAALEIEMYRPGMAEPIAVLNDAGDSSPSIRFSVSGSG
ncbi:MAG: glycosyltransferase family 39 protein [Anaerolineae bacterium]|nr:glycosyltransferase family 39 protein [Anaerolineae bacterium]